MSTVDDSTLAQIEAAKLILKTVKVITPLMQEQVALLLAAEKIPLRQHVIREAFGRATSWMLTMCKLDEVSDIQAQHAGCRALSEIAVDIALLHQDQTDGSAEKIKAFEAAQHLRGIARYHAVASDRKLAPLAYLDQWKAANEQKVLADMARLWPTVSKPNKLNSWNGTATLMQNSYAADDSACACWAEKVRTFSSFYARRNPMLNWATHGTGMAAFGAVKHLTYVSAVAVADATWFTEICVRIVEHEFPKLQSAGLDRASKVYLKHQAIVQRDLPGLIDRVVV